MSKEEVKKHLNILIAKSNEYSLDCAKDYLINLRSNLFGLYLFDFIDRKTYEELAAPINDAISNVYEEYLD